MFNLIHKEGRGMLLTLGLTLILLNAAAWYRLPAIAFWLIVLASVVVYALVLQFFRNPVRKLPAADNNLVYAPADGKICVIEQVMENEFFHEKRLQVSIFMSPLNVHVNRNPLSGKIAFFRYHPGKFLVAWHPKSSEENERTTVVYDTGTVKILMRQIAGAVARRIRWYVHEGQDVVQGDDMGFIKFGSRVDLFLPLDAKVEVKMDEMVKGNKTVIARL
ncbi:MAG: phosphatidylserine decarboxylase family protein [Lewinellaceae bacterium]|nr:phosphatidylserine decarboxylase family protein [Lewinellaceae bacterium]